MMNAVIKRQWLEALRSGDYKQGQGELRTNNLFCCLAVLCDLHRKQSGNGWGSMTGAGGEHGVYLGATQVLPTPVVMWAELDSSDPEVEWNGAMHTLSSLNDEYGLSFDGIADLIEKTL